MKSGLRGVAGTTPDLASAPGEPRHRIYGIRFEGDPPQAVSITEGHRTFTIPVDEIVRAQADDDYVVVHARGRRHMAFIRLETLLARLGHDRFVRVHRSHIVSPAHIVRVDRHPGKRMCIELSDGSSVVTSRRLRREALQRLTRY